VPFEQLFYSLPTIAPDADNTVGFRRQRTRLQAEGEEAFLYFGHLPYRQFRWTTGTGTECRLNSDDSRRLLCSSMTVALAQVSPKTGMQDIEGPINWAVASR